MNSLAPHLFSPLHWHGLELKNRIVMAPMTRGRAGHSMAPNSLMQEYYRQRSSAGLIITEGTFISPQAIGWIGAPGLWNESQAVAWSGIVQAVHQAGTPIFVQLWHTGRASHSDFHRGALPVAPSAIRLKGATIMTPSGERKSFEVPRALSVQEIQDIVEDYRKAALLARQAGFDGIEIHAANGYLIDQFLQSRTNQRDDQYGGSVANRTRFLKEIIAACLTLWPAERIGVRISPNNDMNDMGSLDFRDTFMHLASELEDIGLAYLHVVEGIEVGYHRLGIPLTLEEIHRHSYHGRSIANGGYRRDSADRAIKMSRADLVAFGRPYISNPDLPQRFANDWPLAEDAPKSAWYGPGPEGYTDFPSYKPRGS